MRQTLVPDQKRFSAFAISSRPQAVSGKRSTTIPECAIRRISTYIGEIQVPSNKRAALYRNACRAICSSVADASQYRRANSI